MILVIIHLFTFKTEVFGKLKQELINTENI